MLPFAVVDAPSSHLSTLYDLIANVTHESAAGTTRDKASTVWKAHLRAGAGGGESEQWFQIQDLIVEEIRKEMIFLGETVLQVCLYEGLAEFPTVTYYNRFGSVEQIHRQAHSTRKWRLIRCSAYVGVCSVLCSTTLLCQSWHIPQLEGLSSNLQCAYLNSDLCISAC